MPDLSAMFDKLKGAAYISTFDLQHGFWQAALDPKRHASTFKYRQVQLYLYSACTSTGSFQVLF